MTHANTILNLLREQEYVCTNEFYRRFIADPRTILSRLKKEGYEFYSRPCENPSHNHNGPSKEWKLISEPKIPGHFEAKKPIQAQFFSTRFHN